VCSNDTLPGSMEARLQHGGKALATTFASSAFSVGRKFARTCGTTRTAVSSGLTWTLAGRVASHSSSSIQRQWFFWPASVTALLCYQKPGRIRRLMTLTLRLSSTDFASIYDQCEQAILNLQSFDLFRRALVSPRRSRIASSSFCSAMRGTARDSVEP